MRSLSWTTLFLCGLLTPLGAIDINPSKNTAPANTWNTSGGGSAFSIFNGDPKRIQRANAVDPKSFDSVVTVSPNPLSLRTIHLVGPNPSIKIEFSVKNHAKKTYTLSFPTAQRWDFRLVNSAGVVLYTYTDDHEFLQVVGTSMVNHNDRLSYHEEVNFNDLVAPLLPGFYKVEAVMSNYPQMQAEASLTVTE